MYIQKTTSMKTAEGYTLSLGAVGYLQMLAKAECFVQAVNSDTTPPVPTAVTQVAGQTLNWIHLAAGDRLSLGQDFAKGYDERIHDRITHLLVWAVAAGDLILLGH